MPAPRALLPRPAAQLSALLLILGLAGCVTINIYFPAAAAEKAADRIIDEVWQLQQSTTLEKGVTTPQTPAAGKEARP